MALDQIPGLLPSNATEEVRLHRFYLQELIRSFWEVTTVAPTRPREGMIRFADGTDWDPGSGRGLYQYVSTAWVKL